MSSSGTCSPLLRQRPQLAAAVAGAAECLQVVAIRPLDGPQNVRTVARAADRHEQVAGTGQVLQLLDEDALETLVVGPREDVRRVVGQAEDAQAFLLVVVEVLAAEGAFAHVFAEVRRVGAAAAVADHEDESALLIALPDVVGHCLNFAGIDAQQFLSGPFEKGVRVQLDSEHAMTLHHDEKR